MEIQGTGTTVAMRIIITDTNVFFDVISIKALPEFFALDYEICTTDFVLNEILQSDQKEEINSFIRSRKLTVFQLNDSDIEEIRTFKTVRIFKGITDKTVLWKALQLKCPLLAGDRKLKKEAEDLGIEVHGSIWVITELIRNDIVNKKQGIQYLEDLMSININLPGNEIEKLIKKYKMEDSV